MINPGRALALQAQAIDGGKRGHKRRLSREEKSILSTERKIKANFHSRVKKLAHAPDEQTFLKTRHMIILDILKHLGKDADVFDSQVAQGESITNQALDTIPIFWFKMHHWKSSEVKFLYDVLGYKTRPQLDQEISHVFGGKKKNKKKKNQKKIERGHLRRGSNIYLSQQRKSMRSQHDKSSSAILSTSRVKAQAVAAKLWNRFVKTRGGLQECKDVNEPQWNIALNDCKIIVDPDISFSLYITMLDVAESIQSREMMEAQGDDEEAMLRKFAAKMAGDETPLPETPMMETPVPDEKEIEVDAASEKEAEDEPLTEEEEHKRNVEKANAEKAQRKRMKKTPLTPEHFRCMVIETGGVLKKNRAMRVAKPKNLSERNRNLVIFWKMFDAILKEEEFNVMENYLSDKLTDEELRSSKFIIKELSSRKSDWKNRLAILNFVEDNLEDEDMFIELIQKDDNFKAFIYGWTAQMLDDRSQLSSAAVTLFPSIVSTLIQRKDSAAPFFEDDAALLRSCFEGIFTVLRGRRAEVLSKLAQDSAVRVIDIFANIAEGVTENQKPRSHSVTDIPELKLIQSNKSNKKSDKKAQSEKPPPSPETLSLSPPATDPTTPNKIQGLGLKLNLRAMSSDEKVEVDPVEEVVAGRAEHVRGSRSQSVMLGKGHRRSSRIARSPTITKLASRFEGGFPDAAPPDKPALKSRKSKKHIKKVGTPKPHSHGAKPNNTKITMSKTAYLDLIAVCVKHGVYKNEKHESVRAACMTLCAYLIYGIEVPKNEEETSEKSDDSSGKDNKEEKKDNSTPSMKMNPKPSRAFLMSFDAFMGNVKQLMSNGVNDRAEVVRTRCMKLLQKLEGTFGSSNMDKLFDNEVIYKYKKWTSRQKYAKGKGGGKGKGARSRGESRAAMAKMRQKMMAEKKKKGGS